MRLNGQDVNQLGEILISLTRPFSFLIDEVRTRKGWHQDLRGGKLSDDDDMAIDDIGASVSPATENTSGECCYMFNQ